MQNPGFVTLNNHRIKVQRWHHEAGIITFTTVIRGEHLGRDILSEIHRGKITLIIGNDSLTGTARVTDERKSGVGTTAVYRIEIRFESETAMVESTPLTADEKLDVILAELQAIRREIAELKSHNASAPERLAAPAGASTLLDFDLTTERETTP